jgi:hypothetical protein
MTDTHTHADTGALATPQLTGGNGDLGPGPVPASAAGAQAGPDDAPADVPADVSTVPASITPDLVGTATGPSPAGSGVVAASAELEQLREEAGGLRCTIAGLRSQLAAAEQAHHDDVAAIGSRLLAEAEDRGWCEEYDDVVDSLNARLRVELPLRVRAWEASFDLRVSVRIERARNEDDARAQAATIADQIERAVYGMTAVTGSDVEDIDDFTIDPTD